MFTEVSVTDQVLSFTAYTAAVADEDAASTVGNGLHAHDGYCIKRTDGKPEKTEDVKVVNDGDKAVISMEHTFR